MTELIIHAYINNIIILSVWFGTYSYYTSVFFLTSRIFTCFFCISSSPKIAIKGINCFSQYCTWFRNFGFSWWNISALKNELKSNV